MKDQGIDKGLIKNFNTSDANFKQYFGFRKLFWKYLRKLNVGFYDPCCDDASDGTKRPVVYNEIEGRLEYFDGTAWVPVV